MVFRAQGESPAPRSDKREHRGSVSPATRLQRSREICVTANRLSGGRMGASLLAAAEAATALVTSQWEPAPSQWEGCDFPVGASQIPLGNPTGSFSGGEWDFQRAARKASGRTGGAPRGREGGGSRGEAALAVSHSPARVGGAPLPCARHFLWGTFLERGDKNNSFICEKYKPCTPRDGWMTSIL